MNGEYKMKLFTVALGIGFISAASLSAATPLYVGERLTPENNISLGFQDTPTKDTLAGSTDTGNIATFELTGDYSPMENLTIGADLPFYSATKNVTGNSRTSVGNIGLNVGWNDMLSDNSDDFDWGYSLALDLWLPSSRKTEGNAVAAVNPTTDFYTFAYKATTAHPRAGLFIEGERFMGKTNVGYGYMNISSPAGSNDKNRNTATWQTALTWKAMAYLNVNLEYNTIIADTETFGNTKYRHALTPSVSGSYEQLIASAHVNVPLDKATRDAHNVSFGLNAGWAF
jgi:hypothetical protein